MSNVMGAVLAVASGLAAGLAAERAVVRKPWRPDPDRDEAFGRIRGLAHWVRADDGTDLYAERHPAPDSGRPTIVFSHGYCLNQHSWHFQRRDLRGYAELVCWDQRGHGHSGRGAPDNTTVEQLGRDLAAVIEQTTEGPVVLVGHSMGGMTVMSFARQHPELLRERVVGVGLIATSAGDLPDRLLGVPKRAVTLMRPRVQSGSPPPERVRRFIEATRYTDVNYEITRRMSFGSQGPDSLNQFTVDMLNATPIDVVLEFLPTLIEHEESAGLAQLAGLPALLAVGEADQLTPVVHTERMLAALPEAEALILPDTGHMIQLERDQEITGGIRELVERAHR